MAEFPALPLWTDALLSDTIDLTAAEFGAYMRLLIVAWRRPDCDLPDDDDFLRRSSGTTKNWRRIRAKIMPRFFDLRDARFTQKRLMKERDWVAANVLQRSAAGRASSLKRQESRSTTVASPYQRNGNDRTNTYTHTHKKEDSFDLGKDYKPGFRANRDSAEWKAWYNHAAKTPGMKSLCSELRERASEGREFDFPSQWPPGQLVSAQA